MLPSLIVARLHLSLLFFTSFPLAFPAYATFMRYVLTVFEFIRNCELKPQEAAIQLISTMYNNKYMPRSCSENQ